MKNIKSKKEYINNLIKQNNSNLDENGKNLINININDNSNILSSFSNNKPLISNDLSEYINKETTSINLKKGLHINIKSKEINENKKTLYRQAIINFYENDLINSYRKNKRMNIISLIFLILGIIVLSISLIVSNNNNHILASQIYDIIAWVFVWEATDIFFLQKPEINYKAKRAFEIINSEITFNE